MADPYQLQVDELKKAAMFIMHDLDYKRGHIIIDINTAFNSVIVKVSHKTKQIVDGTTLEITKTIIFK